MPRISEIQPEDRSHIKLPTLRWFREAVNQPGLVQGGIYLLSGPPGAGKTTLALQVAVDIASTGKKVVYVALEQSPADLKRKADQILRDLPNQDGELGPPSKSDEEPLTSLRRKLKREQSVQEVVDSIRSSVDENLFVDNTISGMEGLPDFLTRKVLGTHSEYPDTSLLVVDSLQGLGTASASSKPYQRLYDFNRWAKDSRITVLLIGHVTKGGSIAGPKSLEHNVDCVLYLRKAMRLRPLFVPKNRYGPERHEPLTLLMNANGCLEKSKHIEARASYSYGSAPIVGLIEAQALVKLPKYGEKPGIKAPYLPRQKLNQLVSIINSMHDDIDISDLTFEINCAIPGGRPYSHTLDLTLAISILSSYFQKPIPRGSLFIGELDLFSTVRPLEPNVVTSLAETLSSRAGPNASPPHGK